MPVKEAVADAVLVKQPVVLKTTTMPVLNEVGIPPRVDSPDAVLAETGTQNIGVTAPSLGALVALKTSRYPATVGVIVTP